jgi:hypothetical protein
MHVRGLIELAGMVASHGPTLLASGQRLPATAIEQYWVTSKARLDRWAWNLKRFSQQAESDLEYRQVQWPTTRGVLEEILASEMLTRVWTAVLCIHDRRRGIDDAEPVARSVMIGHMEARHRTLTWMVRGQYLDAASAVRLNLLRRRVERWTDLLVGRLASRCDVSEFAVDPRRARDFAGHFGQHDRGGTPAWLLIWTSLRTAFRAGLSPISPNADLNGRIADSVLSCFPSETFDDVGLLRSPWLMRLMAIADDAPGMIEQVLSDPLGGAPPSLPPTPNPSDRTHRFRR